MLIFAVRLIIEDHRNRLLFLRQTKRNGGRYTLIGGNVEDHEFAREALAREALEEAALIVDPSDLQLVHVLHRHKLKKDQVMLVLYFRATKFRGQPESLEPKKFQDVTWVEINNLPAEVSKPTKHVLSCLKTNQIYSEFPTRSKILAFWEQFGNRWPGFNEY